MSRSLIPSEPDDKKRKKYLKDMKKIDSLVSEIVHKENIKKTESTNSDPPIGLIMCIFIAICFLIGILIF